MNLGLKGKQVLVVGIGKGIGKAISIAYANEGAKIVALSRNENLLRETINIIGGEKKGHAYRVVELMETGTPSNIAKQLITDYDDFDIVIHNIGGPMDIRDTLASVDEWNKVWKLNIGIAIEMNRILIPPMINKKYGRIIHISSISSRILRGSPQYCCAKAYVNAYVTTAGRELADKGIIMSAILPGAIEFENGFWAETKKTNKEKYYGFLKEHQAINRMGSPEEIANFALFLGSEKASFAAGALIPVDGGNM